ncbi:hypothetical protein SEA_LIBERTYBELL_65 [Streptomyces phage LibertyBell]|nr:hypothetical protein SEA_LIBERTYBELL_65 [Streptomyces phage LibertyBell]
MSPIPEGPTDDSIFDAGAGRSRRRVGAPRAFPPVNIPRTYGHEMHDTIFTDKMKPVFAKPPEEVLRRIRFGTPDDWTFVLIGETQKLVTIAEYLHGDDFKSVLQMLEELIAKKDLALYQRNPKSYAKQVERTARKILERIKN